MTNSKKEAEQELAPLNKRTAVFAYNDQMWLLTESTEDNPAAFMFNDRWWTKASVN